MAKVVPAARPPRPSRRSVRHQPASTGRARLADTSELRPCAISMGHDPRRLDDETLQSIRSHAALLLQGFERKLRVSFGHLLARRPLPEVRVEWVVPGWSDLAGEGMLTDAAGALVGVDPRGVAVYVPWHWWEGGMTGDAYLGMIRTGDVILQFEERLRGTPARVVAVGMFLPGPIEDASRVIDMAGPRDGQAKRAAAAAAAAGFSAAAGLIGHHEFEAILGLRSGSVIIDREGVVRAVVKGSNHPPRDIAAAVERVLAELADPPVHETPDEAP